MTKKVRVENADTSPHRIIVQTWVKGSEGNPDTMKGEKELLNPADIGEFYVWSDQYLVVREV